MSKPSSSGKFVIILVLILIAAAAFYGYSKQTETMADEQTPAIAESTTNETPATDEAAAEDEPAFDATAAAPLLTPKSTDIIIGDPKAPNTIVEYASLSCSHCAAFHQTVLPVLEKELVTTGKTKFIFRYFPLNPPALKGAQLVECAGENGLERTSFLKVLFDMQAKWAFEENFLTNLKQIALVGGVDSATFDSCMADADLEKKIINQRQDAQNKLGVTSTPTFFVNGKKYEGERTAKGFKEALGIK